MRGYFKLDRIFMKILNALQTNARITNVELADHVGLSSSACLERVRKLEADGVIAGYFADVSLDKIGPNVTVFAEVTMASHAPEDFRRFEAAIAAIPEIVSACKIAGPYDYLLKIICRDVPTYHQFSESLIHSGIGIGKFIGHIVLDQTKRFKGAPLDHLALMD